MDEFYNNTNSNEIEEQAVEPTTETVTVDVPETPTKKENDIGRKILKGAVQGAETGLAIFGAYTLVQRIRDNIRRRKELKAGLKKMREEATKEVQTQEYGPDEKK